MLASPIQLAHAACDDPGADICQLNGAGTTWTCDLGRISDGQPADIWVVYDGTSTLCGEEYCAAGTDGSSTAFDCAIDAGSLSMVYVVGTDHVAGDDIDLYNGDYNLDRHTVNTAFTGRVAAGAGDDIIYGSNASNSDYTDELHGDDDEDAIYGQAGGDTITGDADDDILDGSSEADPITGGGGNDTITGGGGDDTISGNGGDDVIRGQAGADTITGGSGSDFISGGDDNDDIWGNNGEDVICGDNNDDELYGDNDVDRLWGAGSSDTKDGGDPVLGDYCDTNGTNTNCFVGTPPGTRPGGCPAP